MYPLLVLRSGSGSFQKLLSVTADAHNGGYSDNSSNQSRMTVRVPLNTEAILYLVSMPNSKCAKLLRKKVPKEKSMSQNECQGVSIWIVNV